MWFEDGFGTELSSVIDDHIKGVEYCVVKLVHRKVQRRCCSGRMSGASGSFGSFIVLERKSVGS